MDDIITGIISGNKEDSYNIPLDWTTFDERTTTNQNNRTDKHQRFERTTIVKVRSNVGGWSKPAEEVAHEYLKDLE